MIMKGDNRRTLTNLGRAFVLGLAALTLPLVPALAQEREHEHEERRAHKSISVKKLKEMVHRHELETRKVKQQLAELKSRLHRDGEDVDHEKLHAAHNKLHKHLKVLHERHANLLKEVDGQRIVIEDTERRVRRARKDVDRRDRELRHLHEKHNEKKGDAHDPDHIKSVIQALNQAIHLLHDKGHKRDAEALLQLSAKIHETHNPKHKAKSKTKPRAKYDDYQGRDRKFYEVDRAFAPEQAKAKYSVYAKAYERAKEQKRYDEAKKLHAKMEQIQVEYHAKAKVQEPRPSTGHDARMRKLEERVLHLTRAVEKLIHEKKRSNGRRRDREDVEVEEIEESVIEEEEIEAVEEVEEEINEVRIKLRKSKGANRGRRTVR